MDSDIRFEDVFPYEYKGGGYFREKGIPIGESAEMLHGEQAARYVYEKMRQPENCPNCNATTVAANIGDGTIDVYCEECCWPDEFLMP
jgi:hypothetical protein